MNKEVRREYEFLTPEGWTMGNNWTSVKDKLPPYGEEVEVSFDGVTSEGSAQFSENCTCMMAGIAGGHGYFRDKFATIEDNLVLHDVTHWRPIKTLK